MVALRQSNKLWHDQGVVSSLQPLVDVGGDRPQDANELSKLCVLSKDGK